MFKKKWTFAAARRQFVAYSDVTPWQLAYVFPGLDFTSKVAVNDEHSIYMAEEKAALLAAEVALSYLAPDQEFIDYTDNASVMYALNKGKGRIFNDNACKNLYLKISKGMSQTVIWQFVPT